MNTTNYGNFQDLLDVSPQKLQPAMQRMRSIILEVYPESHEIVRIGEKSATYGIGPKKNSETFVYILPYKNWFNLGFMFGADLLDPQSLLEGSGKKLRHIKIGTLAECEKKEIRDLIEAALDERQKSKIKDQENATS